MNAHTSCYKQTKLSQIIFFSFLNKRFKTIKIDFYVSILM